MGENRRFRSLDGLRGLAAFVVVVYHCVLVVPGMSIPTDGSQPQAAGSSSPLSVIWWLYRTPLRVLWAGPEAVLIFFVLSGFVLCLPFSSVKTASVPSAQSWHWPAYFARRLTRLYLPVWGALVVAVVLAGLVRRSTTSGSVWIRGHQPPGVTSLLHDVTLVLGTTTVDSPLWSLRWEIWFSLLLPVGLVLLRRMRTPRWWRSAILLMAAVSALASTLPLLRSLSPGGYLISGLLQYMPVFAIGMILALNVTAARLLAARLCAGRRAAFVGVSAAVLLVSPSYLPAAGIGSAAGATATAMLSLVGVVLVILLALQAGPLAHFLRSPVMRWAGSRSFSLYLVHEPVIVAVALLTKAGAPWPWAGFAVIAAVAALLAAELFYRLVERPAHRLSARVGRVVTDRRSDVTDRRSDVTDRRSDVTGRRSDEPVERSGRTVSGDALTEEDAMTGNAITGKTAAS